MKCLICDKEFTYLNKGKKRIFCFDCSPQYKKGCNIGRSETITSIRRAIKKELVAYKGGMCEICEYNKCLANLEFHHINSEEKKFELSIYNRGTVDMDKLRKEADKCMLLCANCHGEQHFMNEN